MPTMQVNTKPEMMQIAMVASKNLGLLNVSLKVVDGEQQMDIEPVLQLLEDLKKSPCLQSVQLIGDDPMNWSGFERFSSEIGKFRMGAENTVALVLSTSLPAVTNGPLSGVETNISHFDVVKVLTDGVNACPAILLSRIRQIDHPNVHLEWKMERSTDEVRLCRGNWNQWQQFAIATGCIKSIQITPSVAARSDHSFWKSMAEQMALIQLDFAGLPEKRVPYLDGRQEQMLANIANDPTAVKQLSKCACAVKNVSCCITPRLDVYPCSIITDGKECWEWRPSSTAASDRKSFLELHAEKSQTLNVGYDKSTCRKRCTDRNFQCNIAATTVSTAPLIDLQ